MLSFISWQQYFLFLLIAVVVYYSILVLFFGVRIPVLSGSKYSAAVHPEDTDEMMTTAQQVMDELRPLFTPRANKQELMYAIQLQLKLYNQWDEPGFRDTIQNFIIQECERCSIKLNEDDLWLLW